ncbi:MAG: hypothetical protein QOE96_2735 [Blastocatellia bacterium]|jgi:hypothetical protein|nr:hypothetical protein [Blastocatellia bacterium]
MKNRITFVSPGAALRLLIALAIAFALSTSATAQTPGGTTISNQASASYSDGTNTYNTVSNTVTVTVSNVSGLAITPDVGSNPSVVAGQTGVIYNFTVTNTGNFSDQVHFLAGGASASLSGASPATITNVVIDVNNDGAIDGGDTLLTGGAAVDSAFIAQNASIHVLVEVSVNVGATSGQTIQVFLGDAATGGPSYDNQPLAAVVPSHEVRTVSATSVNGQREARGDISTSIVNDALLQVTVSVPAGPVNLGADITYGWTLQNVGLRNATAVTLAGLPAVYIIAPIPLNTVLKAGQTFPANTLYSTTGLGTAPLSAAWTTTPPAPLSLTKRIAFPVAAPFAPGPATAPINMVVTVNTGIDASLTIDEIGDTFGKNSLATTVISDQSDKPGQEVPNNYDGNADFNEGYVAGVGHGIEQRTTLTQVSSVLVGPSGAPGAIGPTDSNDDYSNKAVNTGIAGVAPGGVTTASGQLVYVNTIQNTGNTSDTYTIDAPTVPAGFTVEVSTNGGGSYTTVSGGGSVSLAIAFAASANINVRITEPAGKTVLTGFDSIIRATSTVTPAAFNKTIDRLYTGFVRLDKAFTVANATGVGAATDPVPGAVITYNITYTNVSSSNGDANCVKLTASSLVITEDGLAAPNNWGTYTANSGSPSDSGSGTAATVSATKYTDTVASVAPGASAVFTFKRSIN